MASIHSVDSQNELLTYLRQELGDTQNSFWIGLNNMDGTYKWTDESIFDFGSDVSGGVYPWGNTNGYNQPDNAGEYCIETGDPSYWNNRWNDLDCTQNRRFVCNDCYGAINKYKVSSIALNRESAKTHCNQQYGTELASIHSGRDMSEIGILCNVINANHNNEEGCWFGLYDEDNFNFVWDDETAMDYGMIGQQYPWGSLEPNNAEIEKCVVYNLHDYNYNGDGDAMTHNWVDVGCDQIKYPVCNAPSTICDGSDWNVISGNWNFGASDCSLNAIDEGADSLIFIDNILNNYGNTLVVELMYNTQSINGDGDVSGIVILNEYDVCQYYFVGISATKKELYLQKKFVFNDTVQMLQSEILPAYELDTDYLLRAQIINDNVFLVEVNTVQRINYSVHDSGFNVGFVGLQTLNNTINVKSMYVSGTNSIIADTPQFQHCSQTSNPTLNPSNNPTVNPSDQPTRTPTSDPTKIPTDTPSANPTSEPSSNPTLNPTSNPTVVPTENPTFVPIISSTLYPTLFPSSTPSYSPSRFPRIRATLSSPNNPSTTINASLSSTIDTNSEVQIEINGFSAIIWVLIVIISCLSSIVCCLFYFVFCRMKSNRKRKADNLMLEMNKTKKLEKVKSTSESTNTKAFNVVLRASPGMAPISPVPEEQMNQSSTDEMYENVANENENLNITPQPSPNITPQISPVGTYQEEPQMSVLSIAVDRHSSDSSSTNDIFVNGDDNISPVTSEGIDDV